MMLRRRNPYKKIYVLFLATGFILFVWFSNMVIRITLFEMAEVRGVQLATEAINNAVRIKVAEENMDYYDIIKIHKDINGKLVLIEANTIKINRISSETTLAVQAALIRLSEQTMSIPLGQITRIDLLANRGPLIKVEIVPMGSVSVDVDNKFEQAGINQTKHSIYLTFNTDVRIVIPFKSGRASVITRVPIAENIIIGEVPTTFVTLPDGLFGAGIIGR